SDKLPITTLELPPEIRTFMFNYEGCYLCCPTRIILLDLPCHLFASKCTCLEFFIPPVNSSITCGPQHDARHAGARGAIHVSNCG
ncbi:hypothetical protein PAXRUDRAFT_158245, partial [Paxillus rubicundulus Ve08.2h10]